METKQEIKSTKPKLKVSTVALRVKRETKRLLQAELTKINKKTYGRNVRVDALIIRMLGYLSEADTLFLQEESLTNADRLEKEYQNYLKSNPKTSKDEFIGMLLSRD
jgi:hypothetical protein